MNIVVHELGHALHYLCRWPQQIEAVEIIQHAHYSEAVPVPAQNESLGVGTLVQYLAGSVAERIAMGERDIIRSLLSQASETFNPFAELVNTPCRSEWDYQAFSAILKYGDVVDVEELGAELIHCENLLREYLPRINLHDVTQRLQRDGRLTLTLRDVSVTVH